MDNKNIVIVKTADLAMAAYWKMKGLRVIKSNRCEQNSREFEFVFEDKNGIAEALSIEFANSEAQRFDAELRALKKLCNTFYRHPKKQG